MLDRAVAAGCARGGVRDLLVRDRRAARRIVDPARVAAVYGEGEKLRQGVVPHRWPAVRSVADDPQLAVARRVHHDAWDAAAVAVYDGRADHDHAQVPLMREREFFVRRPPRHDRQWLQRRVLVDDRITARTVDPRTARVDEGAPMGQSVEHRLERSAADLHAVGRPILRQCDDRIRTRRLAAKQVEIAQIAANRFGAELSYLRFGLIAARQHAHLVRIGAQRAHRARPNETCSACEKDRHAIPIPLRRVVAMRW